MAGEGSEEFPPTPSDTVIHAVYPGAARSLTGLKNSHREKDTELIHSHSLVFFHGFLKQRGVND